MANKEGGEGEVFCDDCDEEVGGEGEVFCDDCDEEVGGEVSRSNKPAFAIVSRPVSSRAQNEITLRYCTTTKTS